MPRMMPRLCMLIFGAWLLCPPAIGGAERPAVTQHDIAPLMMLRCTACHGPRKQEAKLDLRTRESMLRGGKSRPAIVPGKPEESLVLKKKSRRQNAAAAEGGDGQREADGTARDRAADEVD